MLKHTFYHYEEQRLINWIDFRSTLQQKFCPPNQRTKFKIVFMNCTLLAKCVAEIRHLWFFTPLRDQFNPILFSFSSCQETRSRYLVLWLTWTHLGLKMDISVTQNYFTCCAFLIRFTRRTRSQNSDLGAHHKDV